ncbi:flagellar hook-length control protein FliK [Stenotrophomonas oahuensis]|uniref:Flagellar hook-length control protein FliK n=1 Tax=Stenotrophomonas oahuensis TaxID=3003271 RepID=A0ABY9YM10_9GAMM|nr:flagellar hook-length control protein FliK [Stenotrophomonas sp. A5586]WNH51927.1 flagellar hook-length control protein FliK [Stenotrophomonas sp. A5586]
MSPTLLAGSAPSAGTSTSSTSAGSSNSASGGTGGRQDFDALLKGGKDSARAPEASAKPKPKSTDSSQSKDDTTAAKDPSGKRSTDKPGHADETSSDATVPATASAEASSPAEPATGDEADAAPWPPLGLAGLALTGLVPAATDAQAAAAASTPVVADTLLAGKADNLPTANTPAPATGGPTTAAPAVNAAAASADAGPIALPLDAAANDEIALPKALADALSAGATDADAPATPFLHALQTAAELKSGAASTPFAGSPTATPHVGGESFDEDISARIGWLADQKIGHATIKVTPHDLGLIEVRLQMDGDKVHASFSSAHADVRHALESTLPRLREMLNDQGFQLGNADVGHQQTAQDGKSGGGGSERSGIGGGDEPAMVDTTISSAQLMRQRGLVDAYA